MTKLRRYYNKTQRTIMAERCSFKDYWCETINALFK